MLLNNNHTQYTKDWNDSAHPPSSHVLTTYNSTCTSVDEMIKMNQLPRLVHNAVFVLDCLTTSAGGGRCADSWWGQKQQGFRQETGEREMTSSCLFDKFLLYVRTDKTRSPVINKHIIKKLRLLARLQWRQQLTQYEGRGTKRANLANCVMAMPARVATKYVSGDHHEERTVWQKLRLHKGLRCQSCRMFFRGSCGCKGQTNYPAGGSW